MYCSTKPSARAFIKGNEKYPELRGEVTFSQMRNAVLVSARISGLPKTDSGFFGFHIHEGGACEGEDFSETKGHYNPQGEPHPRHGGDLPPLLYCAGRALLEVMTDRFSVCEIIGRTVIIHGGTDDFRTQPSGDAGEKIACGVIRRV